MTLHWHNLCEQYPISRHRLIFFAHKDWDPCQTSSLSVFLISYLISHSLWKVIIEEEKTRIKFFWGRLLPLFHDLVLQDNVISYLYPILITDILTPGKFIRQKKTEITLLELLILPHHQGTDYSLSLYFSILNSFLLSSLLLNITKNWWCLPK